MASRRLSSSTAEDFVVPAEGETFAAEDGTVSQVLDALNPSEEEIRQYAETNMGMNLPEENRYLHLVRELLKRPLSSEWKPCRTNDEVYYFNFRTGESSWDHPLHEEYMDRLEDERERAARQQLQQPRGPSAGGAAFNPVGTAPAGMTAGASAAKTTINSNIHTNTNPSGRIQSEAEKQLEVRIRAEIKAKHEAQATQAASVHASKLVSLKHLHEQDMNEARAADAKRRETLAATVDAQKRTRLQTVRERCDNEYRTQLTDLGLEVQSLTKQLNQLNSEAERAANSREKAEAEQAAKDDLARAMRSLTTEMNAYKSAQQREKDSAFSRMKRDVESETQKAVEAARASLEDAFVKEINAEQEREDAARRTLEERTKTLSAALETTRSALASIATSPSASPATASGNTSTPAGGSPSAYTAKQSALAAAKAALAADQARYKTEEDAFRKTQEQTLANLRQQLRSTSSQLSTPLHSVSATSSRCDDGGGSTPRSVTDKDGPMKVSVQVAAAPSTHRLPTAGLNATLPFGEQRKRLEKRYAELKQKELAALSAKRQSALAALATSSAPAASSTRVVNSDAGATPTTTNWNTAPSVVALKEAHAEEQASLAARYEAMEARLTEQLAKELSDEAYSTKTAFNKEVQQEVMSFEMELYIEQAEARRQRMQREFDIKRDKMIADHELALAAHERHKAQNAARQESEKEEMRKSMLDDLIKPRLEKEREKFMSASSSSLRRRESQYVDEERAIKHEVDEEMQAYERAEKKKAEHTTQAEARQQNEARAAQQQHEEGQNAQNQKQLSQQREAFEKKKQEATDAIAEATKALSDVRASLKADTTAQQEALRALSVTLKSTEDACARADAMPVPLSATPQPAAAPTEATAAAEVVTRLVAPSNSVLKSVHAARLTAMEEGFQAQVREATETVDQWRARRLALPTPTSVRVETSAAEGKPLAATAPSVVSSVMQHAPSSYEPTRDLSQSTATAASGVGTARYVNEQQRHIRRRQQALLSARAQYQREQQQEQQLAVQHQAMLMPSYTAYSRSRSAAPSLLWQNETPPTTSHMHTQRSLSHTSGVSADGLVGSRVAMAEGDSVLLTSQLAVAVRHLNSRLDQLSSQVLDGQPRGAARAASSRSRQPESSARQSSGVRRGNDRDGGHSTYRAHRRHVSSSPLKASSRGQEDVSRKWDALLMDEMD